MSKSRSSQASASPADGMQECHGPRPGRPLLLGTKRGRAGQRHGRPQHSRAGPETHQGAPHCWAGAAHLDPDPEAIGGGQQRDGPGLLVEELASPLHLAFLVEVGFLQPLMQGQSVARGVEDDATINDAGGAVEPQPQSFDGGREVPGVDGAAVDGGLTAHGVQPDPMQEGGKQRVAVKSLVEPRDGRRGAR